LGLPIVENSNPVGVLQIIRGADPMLGITAVLLASPREPGASPAPPPVAKRETFFEATPIWLRADRKPKASGSGFEIRVADLRLPVAWPGRRWLPHH
jgi:hypothetical protein